MRLTDFWWIIITITVLILLNGCGTDHDVNISDSNHSVSGSTKHIVEIRIPICERMPTVEERQECIKELTSLAVGLPDIESGEE